MYIHSYNSKGLYLGASVLAAVQCYILVGEILVNLNSSHIGGENHFTILIISILLYFKKEVGYYDRLHYTSIVHRTHMHVSASS